MSKQELPRKLKKKHFGVLKNKNKIVKSILNNEQPCYKCGCLRIENLDHDVGYPEVWIETFCTRCDTYVGGADNSRYEHFSDTIHDMLCEGFTFNESVKYIEQL